MLSAFFLTVSLLLLPLVVARFVSSPPSRASRWPIVIGLHAACLASLASLYQGVPYDLRKLVGLVAVSVVFSVMATRNIETLRWTMPWWAAFLFAGLLVLPHFWILGHQGWEFDAHKLFAPGINYFRGPLNTDGERNVVLTEALLRRDGSPFLPDGKFVYQLFWFYVSALIAGVFSGLTKYSVVAGISTGLAFVFFMVLTGVVSALSPRTRKQGAVFALLLILLVWHSDFIHLMGSLFKFGRFGMEADGSIEWVFFRNFSLQLTTLLSPHHCFFFLFVSLFIYSGRVWTPGRGIFFVASALASPLLALLTFPWFLCVEWLRKREIVVLRPWVRWAVVVFFCHGILYRFPLWDHFIREVGNEIVIFPFSRLLRLGPLPWLGFASLWMTSLGFAGLFATATLLIQYRSGKIKARCPFFLAIFLGNIVVYYVVTGMELQRHFAIVSSFFVVFYVMNQSFRLRRIRGVGIVFSLFVFLSAGFQLYFIGAFTQPPSVVRAGVPWRDYFEMNQKLRREFEGQPVLSAMIHENGGFPISLEAATGFSVPFDTFIYTRVDSQQKGLLMRVNAEKRVVPFGLALGYRKILWGPAEDRAWGPAIKERFIDPRALLAETGSVGLYALHDRLREKIDAEFNPGTLAYDLALGEQLFQGEWNQEAFDIFQAILKEHPEHRTALSRTAKIFLRGGKGGEALPPLYKLIEAEPVNADALYDAGSALALTENWGAAKEMYERCLRAKPHFAPAQYRKGKMLSMLGKIPEAVAAIELAIQWDPTNPIYQGGLGILYDRIGDTRLAQHWYEKSLKLDPNQTMLSERLAALAR